MNLRSNRLFIVIMILLSCAVPLSMSAMLSKPKFTEQEKIGTQYPLLKYKYVNEKFLDACADGDLKAIDLLIKTEPEVDLNYYGNLNVTPLYYAVATIEPVADNNIDLIRYLIENGADIDALNDPTNNDRVTALNVACQLEKLNVVMFLLEHGAALESRTREEETPLFSACARNKDTKVVDFLISKGADINAKNIYGQSPLMAAIWDKRYNIAKQLLKAGAGVQAKNKWGETALHFACAHGNVEMVELLLKAGADAYAEEITGIRPIDVASLRENNKMILEFNKYGVFTKSQQQADEAMHKFFKELNQERLQKIEQRAKQKQRQQPKKIEPKKQVIQKKQPQKIKKQANINEQVSSSEVLPVISSEQVSVITNSPIEIQESTTTASSTVSKLPVQEEKKAAYSSQSQSAVIENDGYQIIEGKQLKWPRSLSAKQEQAIEKSFKQLQNWPNHGLDVKKLAGKEEGKFRLRVGGYRIVFSVNTKNNQITIQTIGLRKNVYKRLS